MLDVSMPGDGRVCLDILLLRLASGRVAPGAHTLASDRHLGNSQSFSKKVPRDSTEAMNSRFG
jgi:hypothetical protein